MSKRICQICGFTEDEHHEFVPMPDGCQCPLGEWGDSTITPICAEYIDTDAGVCRTCEHNRECHGEAT